jgi:hypothetical protein
VLKGAEAYVRSPLELVVGPTAVSNGEFMGGCDRAYRSLTDMNFSKFTGMQSPVGKPKGERVASQ